MNYLKIFIWINFLTNSSQLFAEKLKIKSEPSDSTVSVRELNAVQGVKVGVTPYEANINDLSAAYGKSNFFLVVVEKEGYESQSIIVNDLLKSDIDMTVNLTPKEDMLYYRGIDKGINNLFESQRLLRSQLYDEAIALLKTSEKEQPKISLIPELIGSAFYLKKDPRSALAYYEKAYRLNPDNKDAFAMKSYLIKALGGNNAK